MAMYTESVVEAPNLIFILFDPISAIVPTLFIVALIFDTMDKFTSWNEFLDFKNRNFIENNCSTLENNKVTVVLQILMISGGYLENNPLPVVRFW